MNVTSPAFKNIGKNIKKNIGYTYSVSENQEKVFLSDKAVIIHHFHISMVIKHTLIHSNSIW